MTTNLSADCIIVGGGIGGAALALALGQRGRHALVLEREASPAGTARPEILAKSTMEIFQRLGIGDRMRKEAMIPLQRLELFGPLGKPLLSLSQEDFQRVDAQPYSTDPARTRKILLEAAQSHGMVQVRQGVEVHELLREEGKVAGVQALHGQEILLCRAPLVVGDDGGKSRIRAALDIPLRTREFAAHFLGAVGPALPGLQLDCGQAWVQPGNARHGIIGAVFMPLPDARTAMAILLSAATYARFQSGPPEAFYKAARELSPVCEGLERMHKFPEGFGHFVRPFGHAQRYVADGAAILGDAAHPVTPAGGQGANMSVADAMVLADVAAKALKANDVSASRLAEYETLRRPANSHSLRFSMRAHRAIQTLKILPWLAPLLLQYIAGLQKSEHAKERFIRAVSRAFVTQANP